jgi:glyoxylase-like metal-dependent hydrolase (beta-lactamase superfamily II)
LFFPAVVNGPFVQNAYLVWDEDHPKKEGIYIDPGSDVKLLMKEVKKAGVDVSVT